MRMGDEVRMGRWDEEMVVRWFDEDCRIVG